MQLVRCLIPTSLIWILGRIIIVRIYLETNLILRVVGACAPRSSILDWAETKSVLFDYQSGSADRLSWWRYSNPRRTTRRPLRVWVVRTSVVARARLLPVVRVQTEQHFVELCVSMKKS